VSWLGHRVADATISVAPGACLDETTVAVFVERGLDRAGAARVVGHIDACEDCRRLIAELAKTQVPAE
jgi:hypothetical protein